MKHLRGRGLVACFAYATATVVRAFAADNTSAFSDALAESVRALRIQTDLPPARVVREPHPSFGSGGGPTFDAAVAPELAKLLLWLSFAVILAILAYYIISNYRESRMPDKADGKDGPGAKANAAAAERMTASAMEADELADAGDYAGAMHTLLLRSIAEIRKRLGMPISVSLTSREIARAVRLPPDAGAALSDLVGWVELSYFGSFRPGREEYLRCRRNYDILTEALGRGGGP